MKKIIANPFTPIPKSNKSHVKGWSIIWQQRLEGCEIADSKTDLSLYDEIYIDHGVNFSGSLNLFGGFNDQVYAKCEQLIKAWKNGAEIISLDWDVTDCDYVGQIEKRYGAKTTSKKLDWDFLDDIEGCLNSSETLGMSQLINCNKTMIGDSHAVAYSLPNQKIFRENGRTLHYCISKGVYNYILDTLSSRRRFVPSNEIDLCLGSVDVRFHALRLGIDPQEMAKQYSDQIIEAEDKLECVINPCAPVPIEFEERRIPKSGMYEGKPFYGSRYDRYEWTMSFINYLDNYHNVVMPPSDWYEMHPGEYAHGIMEMTSSVHIAPINYRSVLGW